MTSRVILEADGGSRGNPGPAAYGALIRDAETGIVIAERGETIGVATNNVAEYSGLIAGLELFREHTPRAELEIRMDSKLVIEQLAGRWKIKHHDMVPLAAAARELMPAGAVLTWVPRERNQAADALANAALDRQRDGGTTGWSGTQGPPTVLILLRHGVTTATERKAFSGSSGSDPELTAAGEQQARAAGEWIRDHGGADVILTSPLQRTRQTAAAVADALGIPVAVEPGLIETSFGDWDGYTFAEIQERWPAEMRDWLASTAVGPPGGESFDFVDQRVAAARDKILRTYGGKTVVAVSHVTPIKLMMRQALGAPIGIIYKMELAPASITTIAWWPDGNASLRNFNIVP